MLNIRIRGRGTEGNEHCFQEDEEVRIGRDKQRNDIVLPESFTMVSGEHCILRFRLGRYRLLLNGVAPVYVDGEEAEDDQVLPHKCELRLGHEGPRLLLEHELERDIKSTIVAVAPRPRTSKQVEVLQKQVRRGWGLAAVLFAVLVLAGGILFWILRSSDEEILDQVGAALSSKLEQARPAIYLVCSRRDGGIFEALGTAWVAGRGTLVTAAHVARHHQDHPGSSGELWIRSSFDPPVDLLVRKATLHPGYQVFKELAEQQHQEVEALFGVGERLELISACDVALLKVADADALAPPLAMASQDVLDDLRVTDRVGYIGFPTERTIGINLDRPQPVTKVGNVMGLSNFLFDSDAASNIGIVHFDMGATGGASGSPIIDKNGLVVAVLSAGNALMSDGPGTQPGALRIPSGVGWNFAQRIDLVRELIDGDAPRRLAERQAAWRDGMHRILCRGWSPAHITGKLLTRWKLDMGRSAAAITASVLQQVVALETAGGRGAQQIEWTATEGGHYLAIAVSEERLDIQLRVKIDKDGQSLLAGEDLESNHYPRVPLELESGVPVAFQVSGASAPGGKTTKVHLAVYRMQ